MQKNGGEKLPVVIVGLKSDMKSRRSVTKDAAQSEQTKKGYEYYECSAKACEGIVELVSGIKSVIREKI